MITHDHGHPAAGAAPTARARTQRDSRSAHPRPHTAQVRRPDMSPMWTGPSDGVQVRVVASHGVTAPPAGLTVDLVDPGRNRSRSTSGTTSDSPAIVPAGYAMDATDTPAPTDSPTDTAPIRCQQHPSPSVTTASGTDPFHRTDPSTAAASRGTNRTSGKAGSGRGRPPGRTGDNVRKTFSMSASE